MLFSGTQPALIQGALLDQKAPNQSGTVIVPLYEYVTVPGLVAASTSLTAQVLPNAPGGETYVVVAVSTVFGVTSSSGTLQIEVASGTTAVGSGTNQLTGTMSLAGTANVVVNGTVIATPTTISAGSRLNIILAGTLTGLANCNVTIALKRTA